jgi:hypothetical protein
MTTTPIPDDIMRKATLLFAEIHNQRSDGSRSGPVYVLAHAILAERKRCAELAIMASHVHDGEVRHVLDHVAEAIMKGTDNG